jgi:transposase
MREEVILNKKEQRRLMVLNKMERREISVAEAAQLLSLSMRHVKRLRAGYYQGGAEALAHGNRGRKPVHAVSDGIRHKIVDLVQGEYAGFNQQHYTEMLAEREGISVSRSTVRRILSGVGIHSPRKRRPPKHRKRRERYPQEGMLLQIDGSPHHWLGKSGPELSLIGAIDDATGRVPYALFREQEDAQGYFLLLQKIVETHGIPVALYHDRHGIFERPTADKESIEEQLEGKRRPTQFGRLMEDLGINSISAMTPEAKGRIERLWGTFQDRLLNQMRLDKVYNIQAANEYLKTFLPAYNPRFAVPAAQPGTAYCKPDEGFIPDEMFCFKYSRIVGKDNVVRFNDQRFQILPLNGRSSYAHARVEVHQRMDGSLAIYYQGKCLLSSQAPAEAPVLRTRHNNYRIDEPQNISETKPKKNTLDQDQIKPKLRYKPAVNHPWRKAFVLHNDRG